MKMLCKITVFILCLILCSSLGVFSREEFDSFNVDDKEADLYKFKYDDSAIKMFSGIFCYEFAEGKDIYDIVNSSGDKTAYLITSDNKIEIRYLENGTAITAPISCLARACLSQICVLAKSHGEYFESDVEVINTYIFHEMWGFSIYLITNKGNYVMYKDSIVSEEIYLIPEEVYRECAGYMVSFIKSTEGGTCPGYTYFAELSEYQIYPEKMPDITNLPDSSPDTVPPSTVTITPENTIISPETNTPENTPVPDDTTTENNESSKENITISITPIIIASAIPTLILGVIIILLLKKR